MRRISSTVASAIAQAGLSEAEDFEQSSYDILVRKSDGKRFFSKEGANIAQMKGEAASLRALAKAAPGLAPQVYHCEEQDGTCVMISDYFQLAGRGGSKSLQQLGERMARELHDPNGHGVSPNGKYGFDCPTHCGDTEQDNTWEEDWCTFFRDRRLGEMFRRLGKKDATFTKVGKDICERVVPMLLESFDPPAAPVILHGDLWSGNVSSLEDGSPVIYDPSSCYGHGESDFGIARMFGGLRTAEDAYFSIRPRSQPHHEERMRLYELYHHLNHTLLFGGGYRHGALSICQELSAWADRQRSPASRSSRA